jgi:2',3'-cyclic-nucleotide 2'-phosphodiesterase (5'-nucleotidase family)
MNKIDYYRIFRAVCLLSILFCNQAFAKQTTITFLHINDIHAHLTPHTDLIPDGPPGKAADSTRTGERGGLARLATLLKKQRKQAEYSVTMNIGDTYHGGVEALFTSGNAIVDPVNALGIDVGVPGNWDFAYGPAAFRRRYTDLPIARFMNYFPLPEIERPDFPNIAANITISWPFFRRGKPILPPTWETRMGDVQVGFIGITSDIVPRMHKMLALGMKFVEGEADYRKLIEDHAQTLRNNGADLVVVMSELGIQKDVRLANIINPGTIDVFFSAHTHEATFIPLESDSGALVVEAGNDGYLGRMDIAVTDGEVIGHHWKLLPITPAIAEDPEVAVLVARARAPFLEKDVHITIPMPMTSLVLDQPIDSVVGVSPVPLDRRNVLESRFNRFFTDRLREYAGTDVAMSPGFRFDAVITPSERELNGEMTSAGDVTLEDVYRFFPVEYSIATATTTGRNMRDIIETNITNVLSDRAFQQDGGWVDGYSGLAFTADFSRPDGERVVDLRRTGDNAAIEDAAALTVAGCSRPFDSSGVMCSYPGFKSVKKLKNPATGKAWTSVELFIDMLQDPEYTYTFEDNIKRLHGPDEWPAALFVQPLARD